VRHVRLLAGGGLLPVLMLLTTAASRGQAPPAPSSTDTTALLKVLVPVADAKLEVDGVMTKQTGLTRQFVSPPLTAGKRYIYSLKLTFTDKGQEVVREKSVTVEPGKEAEVDFRIADAKTAPADTAKGEVPEPKKTGPAKATEPEPKKAPEPEPKKTEPKNEPKKEKDDDKTIIVPFVPTPQEVVEEMLKLASVKEGDVVYDLGCGDGRIVVTAVKKYKAKKGLGVDLNPERIKDSEKTAKDAGVQDKVEFKQGDVLKLTDKDIAQADVITLYLLPEVNLRLMPVLKKGLKPGARIVSHDFDMGDWKAEKQIEVKDPDGITHTVYLWTIQK
jgi:uncharacterized protein (TIGR03000 family)